MTGFILYKRCFVKIKFKVIRSATPCLTQIIKIVHGYEKICSLWQHFLAILWWYQIGYTAQEMKKSVMENFIFLWSITCLNHKGGRLKLIMKLLKNLKALINTACLMCYIFFWELCLAGTYIFLILQSIALKVISEHRSSTLSTSEAAVRRYFSKQVFLKIS